MATKNLSFQDKFKAWWETDTAKAVATIVAVLLIPASVIAWNYATTQGKDIKNQLNTDSTTADIPTNEDDTDENATEPEDTDTTDETAVNPTGQDSTTTDTNTDENQPAVGGLGSVDKLPNTGSEETYTYKVVSEDNIYSISMKVCKNDSFYRSNMRKNYLKVDETLKVTCTY